MSFTQRSLPWQNRSSRIEFLKASELPKRSLEFLAIYSEESSSRISPFTSLLINLRTFLTNWVIWLSSPLKKKKNGRGGGCLIEGRSTQSHWRPAENQIGRWEGGGNLHQASRVWDSLFPKEHWLTQKDLYQQYGPKTNSQRTRTLFYKTKSRILHNKRLGKIQYTSGFSSR